MQRMPATQKSPLPATALAADKLPALAADQPPAPRRKACCRRVGRTLATVTFTVPIKWRENRGQRTVIFGLDFGEEKRERKAEKKLEKISRKFLNQRFPRTSSFHPHTLFFFRFLLSLSKNATDLSLSLPLGLATPATSFSTKSHFIIGRRHPSSPASQSPSQAKAEASPPSPASTDRRLPTPFPATTGRHFRRHHDQKNHLNVLYTKVLIVSPFFVLEKSAFYCSSPSFCAPGYCFCTVTGRAGLCARPGHKTGRTRDHLGSRPSPGQLGWQPRHEALWASAQTRDHMGSRPNPGQLGFDPDPGPSGLKAQPRIAGLVAHTHGSLGFGPDPRFSGLRPRPETLWAYGPGHRPKTIWASAQTQKILWAVGPDPNSPGLRPRSLWAAAQPETGWAAAQTLDWWAGSPAHQ